MTIDANIVVVVIGGQANTSSAVPLAKKLLD